MRGFLKRGYQDWGCPRRGERTTSRPVARSGREHVLRRYRRCIGGSVDVSDSLAESLYLISESSGYEIELHEIPADPRAIEIARDIRADPVDIVFNGGEEYELVLSVEESCVESIVEDIMRIGIEISHYGVITESRGLGVRI